MIDTMFESETGRGTDPRKSHSRVEKVSLRKGSVIGARVHLAKPVYQW
jgi:hypothetical protein